jgi:hypothetical protein
MEWLQDLYDGILNTLTWAAVITITSLSSLPLLLLFATSILLYLLMLLYALSIYSEELFFYFFIAICRDYILSKNDQ